MFRVIVFFSFLPILAFVPECSIGFRLFCSFFLYFDESHISLFHGLTTDWGLFSIILIC